MQADLFLVIGIAVGVLALPAMLSAFSESRSPRSGAILVMISAGLIALAAIKNPQGYSIDDVPDVVSRVVHRFIS
jgi:hypothetical protein